MTCYDRCKVVIPFVLTFFLISSCGNILRKPDSNIKDYVQQFTPIGISFDEVLSEIEKQDWLFVHANRKFGHANPNVKGGRVHGDMNIQASLGSYYWRFPFKGFVSAYWIFNEDAELIRIFIWRNVDAL